MNKTVMIRGIAYKMYQAPTGWVFVRSKKTGRTYDVAKIVDGEIAAITNEPALRDVTNQQLAEAWLAA